MTETLSFLFLYSLRRGEMLATRSSICFLFLYSLRRGEMMYSNLSISLLIKERRFPPHKQRRLYCPECKARIELSKVKILVDKQQNDASNVNSY